jgi:hypothetical protein
MILLILWIFSLIVLVSYFTNEMWIWRVLFWLETKTMRMEKFDEDS